MRNRNRKSGQTMVEYLVVFAALLGVAFASLALLRAARSEKANVQNFVASEYP